MGLSVYKIEEGRRGDLDASSSLFRFIGELDSHLLVLLDGPLELDKLATKRGKSDCLFSLTVFSSLVEPESKDDEGKEGELERGREGERRDELAEYVHVEDDFLVLVQPSTKHPPFVVLVYKVIGVPTSWIENERKRTDGELRRISPFSPLRIELTSEIIRILPLPLFLLFLVHYRSSSLSVRFRRGRLVAIRGGGKELLELLCRNEAERISSG